MSLGQVDEELRLARIRLDRTLKAEKEKPDTGTDYAGIIDRQLGRIEGLELTRKRLLDDGSGGRDIVILNDPNPDV